MNRNKLISRSFTKPWAVPAGIILLLSGCGGQEPEADPLEKVLNSTEPAIARVMASPETYEVQIRYTRILRTGDSLRFTDYDYRVDPTRYYYPASTVKFPVALAALEKLNETDSLNRDMRYYIEGDSIEDSFARDIVKIFSVSDNHANNRLFEFLGQDDINRRLRATEAGPVRISHRLGFHRDDLSTQPLVVFLNDSMVTHSAPILNEPITPLDLKGIRKGQGFYENDSLVSEPFDFSLKNYLPLPTVHRLMQRVIFPEHFPPEQRLGISAGQREFLLSAMKMLPREAGYDPEDYPDGYCKFFLFGDTNERIPDHIEIFNKVGFAYGTLTDCAYIRDKEAGVEFFLTATILVNEDGVFNDDKYEYDAVGIPFLAALGRAIYQHELKAVQ